MRDADWTRPNEMLVQNKKEKGEKGKYLLTFFSREKLRDETNKGKNSRKPSSPQLKISINVDYYQNVEVFMF